jgi:predicted Zn-dependent protease
MHIEDNPSLKPKIVESMAKAYSLAKIGAEKETRIASKHFPNDCPWTFEQISDSDFWPEAGA